MLDVPVALMVSFSRPEFYWLFYLSLGWLLVWGGHAFLLRFSGSYRTSPWRWHRLLGLVLLLFPFIRILYGIWDSIAFVATPGTIAPTRPPDFWWARIRRDLVLNLLVPMVGLLMASGHGPRLLQGVKQAAGGLRSSLASVGMWPRVSWSRDLAVGLACFLVVFFGNVMLVQLLAPLRELDTGDASRVFLQITPLLAVGLALMSGLTEEFLYRGVLLVRLRGLLHGVPVWVLLLGSSVFFALAHAGYGTIANMLFPFLFGLVVGAIALLWGVWPAVIVHTLVNLMVFLSNLWVSGHAWVPVAMAGILLVAFVVPLVHFAIVVHRDWSRRERETG
jgi:membrane protease YdiL (CAAX protease family)